MHSAASAAAPAAAASLRAVSGPPPLTARDAACELTRLAAAFAAGFAQLADAAATASSPARRVALATASRRLGVHAQDLAALVPESVLLASARAAGEADPLERPADAGELLSALDAALGAILLRATPLADGALVRAGTAMRAELAALAAGLADTAP